MSDKKISDLQKVTSLSDGTYYVLAAKDDENYQIDLNSVIPKRTNDLENNSGYLTAVPGEYVTETELNAKGYLTEHQSLTEYVKETELLSIKLSQFENDLNFISETVLENKLTAKDYANKDYVDTAISNIEIPTVPTNVSAFTNDKGYISAVPDEYITKTELNTKGYATESYVDTAIESAQLSGEEVDLSGYATKTELEEYAKKSEIPTDYITEAELNAMEFVNETYVTNAINNAQLGGEEVVDLSIYALKSEIPTEVSAFTNDAKYITEDRALELINENSGSNSEEPSVVTYTVTNDLTYANNSNSVTKVNGNSQYTATITPYTGYRLLYVIVVMDGVDITSQVYSEGNINIPLITGNITITANAILDLPESEDGLIWAYKNDDFTTYRSADTSVTTAHIELTSTNYTGRVDQVLQWFPNCVNIVLFSDGTVNTLNGMFGVGNQNSRSQIKSVAFESGHFEGVTDMTSAFKNCTGLEAITTSLPSSVQLLNETFYGCSCLATVPDLSDNITEMEYTFESCLSLINGPVLSGSVQIMHGTYAHCRYLETAYMSLTQKDGTSICLDQIFVDCINLTNVVLVGSANKSLWIYEMFDGVPESTIQETLKNMIPECLDTVSNGQTLYFAAYEGTDYSTYLTAEELNAAVDKGWTVSGQ